MTMTMYDRYDRSTATALAEAQTNALARAGYVDESPPDPDVLHKQSIQALESVAPSAGVAAALLSAAAVHPVPIGRESLEPTGEPLATLAAVDNHWRVNMSDGVGVRAGVQANGSTIFALRGTMAALRGWLADVGAEPTEVRNEYGSLVSTSRAYRPVTPFVQIGWAAPPTSPARSITSFGAGLVDAERQLRHNRGDNERALAATAWLAWTVATVWTVAPSAAAPGEGQQRPVVCSQRLRNGIDVVGEGDVIPWHVRRGNGWTCAGLNVPIASDQPLSPWLADAVGAKWKAIR